MAIFRQYIAPLLALLGFLIALLAVSSRIFLPNDMLAPAPIEDVDAASIQAPVFAQLVVNPNFPKIGE